MSFNNPSVRSVKIRDDFWAKRQKLISDKVLAYQWRILNDDIEGVPKSHCIANFRIAAGLEQGEHYGYPWQDHDLAKWMEAAAFSLMNYPNADVMRNLEESIDLLRQAQQPDGYLNTYYTIKEPDKRFTDFAYGHELLNCGHFLEAAITYEQATGKRDFLDIMMKNVDLIYNTVIDSGRNIFPGHEEIEIALLRLYKRTGIPKYLELAERFIECRGPEGNVFEEQENFGLGDRNNRYLQLDYHQAHMPVRQQEEVVGHCVRAVYLYTAMAMLAEVKEDPALEAVVEKLWKNMTEKKMYITGGIGSQHCTERFTTAYDLPNDLAYNESCAAVGTIMMANGMLINQPDSSVADIMEKVLYNALLAGISYDGEKYFYVNPLEIIPEIADYRSEFALTRRHRERWFDCACCPTNIIRCISSLSQYIYTYDQESVYVNLLIGNEAEFEGERIRMTSNMPWEARITLQASGSRRIYVKKPIWALECRVDGKRYQGEEKAGYLDLGVPEDDHEIEIYFEMEPRFVYASTKVNDDCGRTAVEKGYLIYCAEEIDNGSVLSQLVLDGKLLAKHEEVFEAMDIIYADGFREKASEHLYSYQPPERQNTMIRLVPYYIWNNRGDGEMRVWLRV